MKIKFEVKDKIINIYSNKIEDNLPIVIYNSFDDDGIKLWDECNKIDCNDFILVNISNIKWNDEMTPWYCKSLFKGDTECNGKADEYIKLLENNIIPEINKKLKSIEIQTKYYILAGYSLGGLFSIYSLFKTKLFSRIVSGSGSFWYPNIIEYIKGNDFLNNPNKVYLSLGNKEKNTKNEVMSKVEENTLELTNILKNRNIETKFEFNQGGHFADSNLRIAKGLKWILE